MPLFDYKGLNDKGKIITGIMEADSASDLRNILLKMGIFLTEYAERVSGGEVKAQGKSALKKLGSREVDFSKYFGGVKTVDLAVMTRQFGTLLKAGIPLVGGLDALAEQVENRQLQAIIKTIKLKVNEGSSLADALSEHSIFSGLYINMVRVGEATGTLDIVMLRLADFMDAQVKLKSKLISSMIYPVLLICIAVVIVSLMMLFVIPRITEMFEEMGADLPFLTLVLIEVSRLFGKIWWLIIIAAVAAFYYFKRWRETERGRYKLDSLLLRIPIFGKLIRLIAVARFARTLSTLLSSGVPILTSMEIVKTIVNNVILSDAIVEAAKAIKEGESIAAPLQKSGQFPPMMTHMIAIGEKTGQLEEMLKNVAEAYDAQVENKVTTLTSILEPVMIVGMGIMVAFLVFAILMPMLKMNEAIAGR